MCPPGQDAAVDAAGAAVRLPPDTASTLGIATVALVAAGVVAARASLLSPPALTFAAFLWLGLCATVVAARRHHPHARFGAANAVTTFRALVAVAIGALAVEAGTGGTAGAGTLAGAATADATLWGVTTAAVFALVLDGVDGPLARAAGLDSAFGARYDMEIDALLAFALAALIWRSGELGAWVLALGTMRYLFVAAARLVPALNAPLYPSRRRKVVCVVQIAALCAIVAPLVQPPLALVIGLLATLALGYSFARDTLWLLHREGRNR